MLTSKNENKEKLKIYLADLVHNWIGRGPFMFPINIGYIKAYVNKFYEDIDIKLFKYPDKLMDAIEKDQPQIIGLSNYVWNEDLNSKILKYIKSKFLNIITVMGGPNINIREDLLINFLKKQQNLDFYVIHKGEPGFLNIVNRYLESKRVNNMKQSKIEGVAFLKNNELLKGNETPYIKDLDIFPSSYLTGTLDEFFDDNLIPNIETNRGCPFPCTFCVWGDLDHQKIAVFSFERVKEELIYIAKKVKEKKKTNILCISDANLGIFDNDIKYAKIIKKLSKEYDYPRKVTTFWVKNRVEYVKKIAEVFGDLVSVDASLQSMNKETLKAIKRDNINQEVYKEFLKFFYERDIDSDAELILGLPFETKETHLNALRQLFDMHAGNIVCYNCRILQGAEMSLPEELKKYDIKTKFRLIDPQFGEYNKFKSFEAEEMVRSNNTLSEEDIFYFRPIHWLIQFMYNYKYYKELLMYISSKNINPLDFIIYLLENINKADVKLKKLIIEFESESKGEWFNTKEALVEHYSRRDIFNDLKMGGFGKLNYKYIFKVLLECSNEFDSYLSKCTKELINDKDNEIIDEIIKFERLLRVDFSKSKGNKSFIFELNKFDVFNYDILKWKQEHFKLNLNIYKLKKQIKYNFYLDKEHIEALTNNLNQFKNVNLNLTLRKMSEYMRPNDLFYKVCYTWD